MDKYELLSIVAELITNNSNIGAEEDDTVLIDGLEDVMQNDGPNGTEDVTLLFDDGKTITITAKAG